MLINFLRKSFLIIGAFFLILTLYLQIMQLLSNEKVSTTWLPSPKEMHEIYDEKIARIDNFKDLRRLVDSGIQRNNFEGIEIPIFIDDTIQKKYFHGLSNISAETNWILKVADYFFPEFYFLSAMDPKDLVKKNYGWCNQQAIMFQELIKGYGFEYASIGFNIKIPNQDNFGHFVSAVKIDTAWFYFDSNMEPIFDRKDPSILTKVLNADKNMLKELYPQYNFNLLTKDMIVFRDLNTFPAKRGVLFQDLTQFFSNFLWVFLILFSFLLKAFNLRGK